MSVLTNAESFSSNACSARMPDLDYMTLMSILFSPSMTHVICKATSILDIFFRTTQARSILPVSTFFQYIMSMKEEAKKTKPEIARRR